MLKNDHSFLRDLKAESLDLAFYLIAYPETNEFLRDPKLILVLQAYVARVYLIWRRERNLTTPFILDVQYPPTWEPSAKECVTVQGVLTSVSV